MSNETTIVFNLKSKNQLYCYNKIEIYVIDSIIIRWKVKGGRTSFIRYDTSSGFITFESNFTL